MYIVQAQEELLRTDEELLKIGELLNQITPQAHGKLAIRFLTVRGSGSPDRHPVFVQWHRAANDEKKLRTYTRLAPAEVRGHIQTVGVFENGLDDRRQLINMALELMASRETLLAAKTQFVRALSQRLRVAKEVRARNGDTLLGSYQGMLQRKVEYVRAWKERREEIEDV
jgi:hypothetical protein